jgi:PPOX class probable F420-dependent enzyme
MGSKQRAQVVMTEAEIDQFIVSASSGTLATNDADGKPVLTTVWFGLIDGDIWFEIDDDSQLSADLKHDPRVSFLLKDGLTYDTLRGVSLEGDAELVNDPDVIQRVAESIWERHNGKDPRGDRPTGTSECVHIVVQRIRSWDHRKLGMAAMPLGGTTAPPA